MHRNGRFRRSCSGETDIAFSHGAEMNGIQNMKASYRSILSRSRSDVAKMLNPIGDEMDDKPIGFELKRSSSNKKSNGTPMKMLIARETESKHRPPSVIAKLMGLDTLPEQQPNSASQRSQLKDYSQNTLTQPGTPLGYWQQENGFLDKQIQFETNPYKEQKEYKDVYEVWQQSPKTNYIKDKSLPKGRFNENPNEKKMALVRQKFIEAKRLSMDEKLRQSKEFQDALEVLSSNKDLFLKFLQEPNSLFSQHLCELQSNPLPPQTKCITVLRPSKTVEDNRVAGPEKVELIKKQTQVVEVSGWNKNKSGWHPVFPNQKADNSAQPTRIVVLKPSPVKTHDIKAVVSSPFSSSRQLHSKDLYGKSEDDEAQESREVAKDITQQMRQDLISHRRDETLLSSVCSNGYVGDESSFNRSENECLEEGNLSDSEVMTPTSKHSWDYVNRFGSPYSSSSFSRGSYSPESSVCREAKKRLSERWAMMASSGSGQEHKQVRRSSSTLGEMLALSDTKKSVRSGEEGIDGGLSVLSSSPCGEEQDLKESTSCMASSRNKYEGGDDSPRNLLRSRSVPISSTAYGARLNVEVPDFDVGKSLVPKEVEKSKSGKSSFKWKVSSLFFSRNKVTSKEKSGAFPSPGSNNESRPPPAEMQGVPKQLSPGKVSDDISQCVTDSSLEGGLSPSLQELSNETSSAASICEAAKQGIISSEAGLFLAKPGMPGNPSENQDQPSPISVLDASFEDDVNTTSQSSGNVNSDHQGIHLHLHPLKSNLIDKSPPIESIARTLSWDGACSEIASPNPLSLSMAPPKAVEEEQERFLFVQTLLLAAGLVGEEQSDEICSRWHSPESPLDPSLLEKCVDLKEKNEQVPEAKRRQRRSSRRFLFDCVNAVLVDITGYGSEASPCARASSGAQDRLSVGAAVTLEEVWDRMNEWSEARYFSGGNGDNNSLVVERMVRKEVVGRGWVELMSLEVDGIGKEVEGKMLEELVEEALVEMTGGL
ncbi:hypothetical protein HHK36_026990 [Tetracentron sinense]|uniref:DUF4378 domain-containing protein n=1 Tax=Tetracentron sinense TaxID=13715 RepID=A0A835D602_TETSI|nr:hypothetical protein HHK36_026990 [Tetracentron sinense]